MNAKEFERAVLELAMTTRAPLSRANISFYTGVPAKQAEKWLDELLRDAIVEIDTDDDGEIVYNVTGAKRPEQGATSLSRCASCQRVTGTGSRCGHCGDYLDTRLRALKAEVDRERGSRPQPSSSRRVSAEQDERRASDLSPMRPLDMARVLADVERFRRDLGKPAVADEKNVIVAGILGLFGPLGWFYAGSQREAGIALIAVLVAAKLLPLFVFAPLLTLLAPISALVSVLYAWQYNRTGERASLFLEPRPPSANEADDDPDRAGGRPRRSRRR